jgi:hypothetical protein
MTVSPDAARDAVVGCPLVAKLPEILGSGADLQLKWNALLFPVNMVVNIPFQQAMEFVGGPVCCRR